MLIIHRMHVESNSKMFPSWELVAPFMAAFEVAAAGAALLLRAIGEGTLVLAGMVAEPVPIRSGAVDVVEVDTIGGRDDSKGMPWVLSMGSEVTMLAVASGP